jgi:(p)ppGpp synthase/HD superfamily hydrolase
MTRELAIEIATAAHAGQKRKNSGEDYIAHPLKVAENAERIFREEYAGDFFPDEVEVIARKIYIVGVLHDVIEDTEVNLEAISNVFPDIHILQALAKLTRHEGQTYFDFIKEVIDNGSIIAKIVKIADIRHNMSDLKEGSLKDKYRFALDKLTDTSKERKDLLQRIQALEDEIDDMHYQSQMNL